MTVSDLLALYAADTAPTKASSIRYQRALVYQAVRCAFGPLPVTALTPELLRQWRDQLHQR